jgi:hypothetical protein
MILSDSSDSDDNLVQNYNPKVVLPDIIPCMPKIEQKKDPILSEREKLMLETRKLINQGDSDESNDAAEQKEKEDNKEKRKRRPRKTKDTFIFKPAHLKMPKKQDEMEAIDILLQDEIIADEIPDVFDKNDEKEEESEEIGGAGNWKAQGKNAGAEVIKQKRINPRLDMAMRKAGKGPQIQSELSSDIEIRPPSPSKKGKRPMPKKRCKSVTSDERSNSEREESVSVSSQDSPNTAIIQNKILNAITAKMEKRESSENQESQESAPATVKAPHASSKKATTKVDVQKIVDTSDSAASMQPVVFNEYICSLEDQGKLSKRRFVKLFKDAVPLFSVKLKSFITDGNINVSAGGDPHISNGERAGTIIVANNKTDFSLRKGTYQGQELITIRTTINRNQGKSGHAIYVHGLEGNSTVELYGYYVANERMIEFRMKNTNYVYATFALLSSSTINAKCCDIFDPMRCFAACFALFMTFKK